MVTRLIGETEEIEHGGPVPDPSIYTLDSLPFDPDAFAICPSRDLWIFAYGSLIWNPGFPYEECRLALLHGYHRALCIRSYHYRGTKEQPGLVLGLDRGGSCRGTAFRVTAEHRERVLSYLWQREMVTAVYKPACLRIALFDRDSRRFEERAPAATFVARRDHAQYNGRPRDEALVAMLREAQGIAGRCRDYLANTVAHLESLGIPDRRLRCLLDKVDAG